MGDEYGARAAQLASWYSLLEVAKDTGRTNDVRSLENLIDGLETWQQLQIEAEVDDPSAPNSVNNATGG